jgi:hypothetical protein
MSASWKQQVLLDAPVDEVWGLISDPGRFPDWSGDTISVTGLPTEIERGSTFQVTSNGPLRMKATTVFRVEELDDLREIKLRCQTSGYYSHWLLTEARGNTFVEVEFGIERVRGLQGRALSAAHTKGYLRRSAERAVDGLRRALTRNPA